MSDEGRLLAANGAFYAAFAAGDAEAMDTLWASEAPVACIHPGWPPVHGREKVMSTWAGILQSPPRPAVRAYGERVMLWRDVGAVIGFESIGDVTLVATNLFIREGDAWKLVHHQAAITERAPPEPGREAPRRMH